MSYYFIAYITIHNETEYQKYMDRVDHVFSKYEGEYLVVDNSPLILEGNKRRGRCIIIKFKTRETFDAWYHSEDYQEILKYRLRAAECDTILVKGMDKESGN